LYWSLANTDDGNLTHKPFLIGHLDDYARSSLSKLIEFVKLTS